MRLIYIIFILLFIKTLAFAQTALQLKVIKDPKDTINIELKERYAVTQAMIKLFTAANSNNKQLFLNLYSDNYKNDELANLVYFSDTLQMSKNIPPWKKYVILALRFEYNLNPSKTIENISSIGPNLFFNIFSAKKPFNVSSDKIFNKIKIENNIVTYDYENTGELFQFIKENGVWKLNFLPMWYDVLKKVYQEKAVYGASIDFYKNDQFGELDINEANEEIFKALEIQHGIKISKELWKPIKQMTKNDKNKLELQEQKHKIKISNNY